MDTHRAKEALGGDSGIHSTLALVDEVHVATDGVYVDFTAMPDGWTGRAKLLSLWASAGVGIYVPVATGDQVLVVCPDGDPDGTPVAIAGLWNDDKAIPSEITGQPSAVWIVAGPAVQVKAAQVNCNGTTLTVLGDGGSLAVVDGVVTGQSVCPFTGLGHTDYSTRVRARK